MHGRAVCVKDFRFAPCDCALWLKVLLGGSYIAQGRRFLGIGVGIISGLLT
jgi:hypothetical protein